jgi:YbgC/YbaW family acyl-CoA thioester hydrolase
MFTHQRTIFLRETDSTGVIYFTSIFEYALEAFETFLKTKDISLPNLFKKGYLMPIVHSEADFKAPLRVGDTISIELSLLHIGSKSFSIESKIRTIPEQKEAGRVKIVHAFMKQGDVVSSETPCEIRKLFNEIIF